jgi:hypothetical protein
MAYLRNGSWRQAEKRKEEAEKEGRQPVKITHCAPWDSSGITYRIAVSKEFDGSLGNRTKSNRLRRIVSIVSKEKNGRFREGPFQMCIADFGAD